MLKGKLIIIVIGTLKGMGGAERQAILLAEHLIERNISVKMIAFSGGNTEDVLKVKNIPYDIFQFDGLKPIKSNIFNLLKLTLYLRQLKPYAFIPFITLNSKYIGLIWKYTGAKFACWNQRDEGRAVYGSKLEKLSAKNVPVIVSNSLPGKDILIQKLSISEGKIKIINNGIIIPETINETIDWKKELDLPEQCIIVSMLASIYKYKDHRTLINAWAIVQESFKYKKEKPVLILAGTFKGMEDELKVLCFDLRIADSVYFIGATSQTNSLLQQSNLVVHSSNKEGCPNAVLEAMALSKAVVATNIPGNLQALGEKYRDICINTPNDSNDLASKIVYILEHQNLATEIGEYNFKRIQTEFSISKMVDAYVDLINEYAVQK